MTASSVKYTYVSPGVVNVTDANNVTTELRFTSTGQIRSIKDPLNRTTQFTYDTNDNLSQITAPGKTIYRFSYDAQGRLLSQTDPLNQTVRFTYNTERDLLLTVTDQKGQVMRYGYDGSGNLTGITYASSNSETFTYDINGRLTQATERSGDTFRYTYDAKGRLSRKTFDNNSYEAYTYDSKGNLASVRDVRGDTTKMVYDTQNRLTKITYPGDRFLQYSYDAEGRRTQMKDQSGFTTKYTYDGDGRLTKLTNGSGASIIAYTYDAAGRLIRETNGNSTYTLYTYDTAGQLTEISNRKANGGVNSFFRYTYDSLGRQTKSATSDGTWTYTYDTTGQLTRAKFASTNTSIPNQDLQYVYDAAGNRIRTVINGVTTKYAANNLNQYTAVGTAQQFYDADGNLIRVVDGSRTWKYTYNDENQLTKAVTPDGTFSYEYDAFGNRTAVIQDGQRTEYLVDPFGLGDVVGEYNGKGGLVANYAHGLGLVSRFNGSNANYYDSDLTGSTVGVTNSKGGYVNRYAYRPFGENLITTEGVTNPFEYVGQWGVMHEVSGLNFMRQRYYTTDIGRFAASDPIGLSGGDTNLYTYVFNSPTVFIDPYGTYARLIAEGIGAGLGVAALTGLGFGVGETIGGVTGGLAGARAGKAIGRAVGLRLGLALGLAFGPVGATIGALAGREYGGLLGGALGGLLGGALGEKLGDSLDPRNSNSPLNPLNPNGPKRNPSQSADDVPRGTGNAEETVCPLVLDLDRDGIELTSRQNSQAFFDLDSDGFAEQTGWVKPDDGLLALDKNNNGRIDNITELFGNETTDGFTILKQLDSNKDNLIDNRDAQFANLRVWKDRNSDGFTDAGELQSLKAWKIGSIKLNAQATSRTNAGNRISSTSSFTLTNGTARQIVDVWFSLSQLNTVYTGDFQLKTETLFLPTLRGYGDLPDLFIAMSQDSTLLGLMRNIVQLSTKNYEEFHSQLIPQVEALLYRWAGVDDVASDSRGFNIDARTLGFLEKFVGDGFEQPTIFGTIISNPNPQAANILQETYDNLFRALLGRLVVQGAMRDLFPDATFDLNQDKLETDASLTTVLKTLSRNDPTSLDQAVLYWHLAIAALDAFDGRFGLTQEQYDIQLNQTLGNAGFSSFLELLRDPDFLQAYANVLFGTAGNNTLTGGAESDRINGAVGNDIVSGGAGNDALDGGAGNDTVKGNDGDDIIKAGLGTDRLDGGNGDDTLELNLAAATTNLTITNPVNSSTSLPGVASMKNFEAIHLTTGSKNDTITQASLVNGAVFRSNDVFNGGAGNDSINPGLGLNDQADGGAGTDTLILNYAVDDLSNPIVFALTSTPGNTVSGNSGRTRNYAWIDSITFSNIERFNLTATRGADQITIGGANNTVNADDGDDVVTSRGRRFTINGGIGYDKLFLDFARQLSGVNLKATSSKITIAGVANTISNFEETYVIGSEGNDTINVAAFSQGNLAKGNAGNDAITGGAGRDRLEGGDGSDILNGGDGDEQDYNYSLSIYGGLFGGAGNDTLNGGAGRDNLQGGDGNDTLNGGNDNDYLNPGVGVDTIDGNAGYDLLEMNLEAITSATKITYTTATNGTVSNGTKFRNAETVYFTTGNGADVVNVAFAADSLVKTGAGNDTITGTAGRDRLEGGDGNDILNGGDGDEQNYSYSWGVQGGLFGGADNDTLNGGAGRDNLQGGDGNDTLNGGNDNDYLNPGVGVDTIDGSAGYDSLEIDLAEIATATTIRYTTATNGTVSNGTRFRNAEAVYFTTGNGADVVNVAFASSNLVKTGAGNDTVTGGAGRDRLEGGDGNDILNGGDGDEQDYSYSWGVQGGLFGGAGNDTLNGGAGRDNLQGGDGNDTLKGGNDNDYLNPGAGVDTIDGNAGYDLLEMNLEAITSDTKITYTTATNGTVSNGTRFRNAETVYFTTGNGADKVNVAFASSNLVKTGAGNDTVTGGAGRDRLEGGDGNDILNGGDGDEQDYSYSWGVQGGLFGGAGNDTLNGGNGDDVLNGGGGVDRFVYGTNAAFTSTAIGIDIITDFLTGTDKIVLDKTTFTALTSPAGSGFSTSNEFAKVTTDAAAATSAARIVYNSSNGKLFYNQNGSTAGFGAGEQFASLTANPILNASDFVIQT